jgi:hypothetical protein
MTDVERQAIWQSIANLVSVCQELADHAYWQTENAENRSDLRALRDQASRVSSDLYAAIMPASIDAGEEDAR